MDWRDRLLDEYSKIVNDGQYDFIKSIKRNIVKFIGNITIPIVLYLKRPKVEFDSNIIISMTSFPKRIGNVCKVIDCLIHQTMRPGKIILWLSREQFDSIDELPKSLIKRQKDGLEIRLVDKDYRSHKKYLYVTSDPELKEKITILVDDDMFYRSDFVETLYNAYQKADNPKTVVCKYSKEITYDQNGNLLPYIFWKSVKKTKPSKTFFGSGGGTMLRFKYLPPFCGDIDLALKVTPMADDVWLNAMCRIAEFRFIPLENDNIMTIYNWRNQTLSAVNNGQNLNDKQIEMLRSEFIIQFAIDPFSKENVEKY